MSKSAFPEPARSEPEWLDDGLQHIWLPYSQMKTARRPVAVRETRGSRIILEDGRELIDGIGSWWTAVHGYNHPHILEAVRKQLERMPHVMLGGLVHEQVLTLARRLAAMLPGDLDRVFFSESGSVAVEIAMKMVRQYWINRGEAGRTKFIAFKGGYHGDTLGAMVVSDPDAGMHEVFRGSLPEHVIADLPADATSGDALELVLAISRGYGIEMKADDERNGQIFASLRNLARFVEGNRK